MGFRATPLILVLSAVLLFVVNVQAIDIVQILNGYQEFRLFSNLLTQTGVAAAINSRHTITVLVVDDAAMGPIVSKPQAESMNILATHVILDYYDEDKLSNLPDKTAFLTTLFQTTGLAVNQQGFLNVTITDAGDAVFGSAIQGAPHASRMVGTVAAEPYEISVIQISQPIMTPGLSQIPPSSSPISSPSPNSAAPVPASAYNGPTTGPTPTPAPTSHEGPASVPAPQQGPAPSRALSQGPAFAPFYQGPAAASTPQQGPAFAPAFYQGPAPAWAPHQGPVSALTPQYLASAPALYNGPASAPAPYEGPASTPASHEVPAPAPASYEGPIPAPAPYEGPALAPAPDHSLASAPTLYELTAPAPAPYEVQVPVPAPHEGPSSVPAPAPHRHRHEASGPEAEGPSDDEDLFAPELSPVKTPTPAPSPAENEADKVVPTLKNGGVRLSIGVGAVVATLVGLATLAL